jgi:hypothetical protein
LAGDNICAGAHAERNNETNQTVVLRCAHCIHAVASVMCTPANTRSVRPARILHRRLERIHDLFRADRPSVRRQHPHLCIPQQRRMVRLRLLPWCLHIRGRRWFRGFASGELSSLPNSRHGSTPLYAAGGRIFILTACGETPVDAPAPEGALLRSALCGTPEGVP